MSHAVGRHLSLRRGGGTERLNELFAVMMEGEECR